MMIENNYSIDVAKMEIKADHIQRYYHYCRIELGNMLPDEAKEKFREICSLFSRWEFGLTLNYIECSSKTIEERG